MTTTTNPHTMTRDEMVAHDNQIAELAREVNKYWGFIAQTFKYREADKRQAVARQRRDEADHTAIPRWHLDGMKEFNEYQAHIAGLEAQIAELDQAYTRWNRFYGVARGHIHSSTNCPTCNKNGKRTRFGWFPELSGLTQTEAVDQLGPALCSVCFPDAPVEHQKVTKLKKSQVND